MVDSVYKYFVVRSVPLTSFVFWFCMCVCLFILFSAQFNYFMLLFFSFTMSTLSMHRSIRRVFHRRDRTSSRAYVKTVVPVAGRRCIAMDYYGTIKAREVTTILLLFLFVSFPSSHQIAPYRFYSLRTTQCIWSVPSSVPEFLRLLFCNTRIMIMHVSFDHPTNCKSFSTHFNLHTHTHSLTVHASIREKID